MASTLGLPIILLNLNYNDFFLLFSINNISYDYPCLTTLLLKVNSKISACGNLAFSVLSIISSWGIIK